ncbi:hypothetical protein RI054_08g43680 [Pseudoscourfieldia marina]
MVQRLEARASGMTEDQAEAANPAEAVFMYRLEDVTAAKAAEHRDVISESEWREQRHTVAGLLETPVREFYGGSGVRRLRRWARGETDAVPAATDWSRVENKIETVAQLEG